MEPRTKRRSSPAHVLCIHSPYRDYIKTRLKELAERGLDAIYFDSWHMPAVCACEYTRRAYEEDTGKKFPFRIPAEGEKLGAGIDLDEEILDGFESYAAGTPPPGAGDAAELSSSKYLAVSEFVSRSLVETFTEWRTAVREVNEEMFFAVGSSLYPCFHTQPHLTDDFLELADTPKTEFHKPFGGPVKTVGAKSDFAVPAWDIQTALGWTWTRDSSGGRPPLMWIPFITEEKEALYSSAAAVTYGAVASLALRVVSRRTLEPYRTDHQELFGSSFAVGRKVSPYLAYARPIPWAAIHISEAARNRRLGDSDVLWEQIFSPVLGVFQALKEEHLPCVTVTDKVLREGRLSALTKLLILPWPDELSPEQTDAVERFRAEGGNVLEMDYTEGWHRASRKPGLMRDFIRRVYRSAGHPSVKITGPAAMHAVQYLHPETGNITVCLTNSWGWYRSERPGRGKKPSESPHHISNVEEPPPCAGVVLEIDRSFMEPRNIFEATDSADLSVERLPGRTLVRVPAFQIFRCIVIQ